jgi:hypothetical protein
MERHLLKLANLVHGEENEERNKHRLHGIFSKNRLTRTEVGLLISIFKKLGEQANNKQDPDS